MPNEQQVLSASDMKLVADIDLLSEGRISLSGQALHEDVKALLDIIEMAINSDCLEGGRASLAHVVSLTYGLHSLSKKFKD